MKSEGEYIGCKNEQGEVKRPPLALFVDKLRNNLMIGRSEWGTNLTRYVPDTQLR